MTATRLVRKRSAFPIAILAASVCGVLLAAPAAAQVTTLSTTPPPQPRPDFNRLLDSSAPAKFLVIPDNPTPGNPCRRDENCKDPGGDHPPPTTGNLDSLGSVTSLNQLLVQPLIAVESPPKQVLHKLENRLPYRSESPSDAAPEGREAALLALEKAKSLF